MPLLSRARIPSYCALNMLGSRGGVVFKIHSPCITQRKKAGLSARFRTRKTLVRCEHTKTRGVARVGLGLGLSLRTPELCGHSVSLGVLHSWRARVHCLGSTAAGSLV